MSKYFAPLTIVLMLGMVLTRALLMKKQGIEAMNFGKLITSGIFALSRNPIYVAFAFILLGQFLIFSNWILLVYTGAAIWLFHRQVLREEDYLKQHYGNEYLEYCDRVSRYL